MKTYFIKDKTFKTFCKFHFECTEEEFIDYINKKNNTDYSIRGCFGKSVIHYTVERIYVDIWVKRKDNLETLSHEILHLVNFWLSVFFNIPLNKETDEIYTMLHSFYFNSILKKIGFANHTSNYKKLT